MRLEEALFASDSSPLYILVDDHGDLSEDSYLNWNLWALGGPTLSGDDVPGRRLDGLFILEARFVKAGEKARLCYLGLSMPGAVPNSVYLMDRGRITQKYPWHDPAGKAIPVVAIEEYVDYELYYSKADPEVGLGVLSEGLRVAKTKWPIALVMALILRDEQRFEEALPPLTLAIEQGPEYLNKCNYTDRAAIYEALGDSANAERDREKAASIRE